MKTKTRALGTLLLVTALAGGCGDSDKDVMPGGTTGDGNGETTGDGNGETTGDGNGETTGDGNGETTGDGNGDPDAGMVEKTCKIAVADRPTKTIDGDITKDTSWTCDYTYLLAGRIYVKGGTLKIGPGTVIQGDMSSALFVTSNAKIDAQGTAAEPIVFTSIQPEGTRAASDWQGIILMGKAKINVVGGVKPFEGLPDDAENLYGGTDDKHDCGTMKYVRIEFAGYQILTDVEVNGLSLCGCGSDTTIDYVQSHQSADDGVEIFGGTVSVKHIVSTSYDDDGLDWDEGWTGNAQFVVAQQPAASTEKDPNGIEADGQRNDFGALPLSNPTIYNTTFIGGESPAAFGMVLRRGTQGTLKNVVLQGFLSGAIDVLDGATATHLNNGDLVVSNSVFFGSGGDGKTYFATEAGGDNDDEGFDEKAFFTDAKLKNAFVDPKLGDAESRTNPNFVPAASSPAKDDAATPPDDGWFDATAAYKGAFEPGGDDWTAGWTSYPAN